MVRSHTGVVEREQCVRACVRVWLSVAVWRHTGSQMDIYGVVIVFWTFLCTLCMVRRLAGDTVCRCLDTRCCERICVRTACSSEPLLTCLLGVEKQPCLPEDVLCHRLPCQQFQQTGQESGASLDPDHAVFLYTYKQL